LVVQYGSTIGVSRTRMGHLLHFHIAHFGANFAFLKKYGAR
jgi:hypothetical protein